MVIPRYSKTEAVYFKHSIRLYVRMLGWCVNKLGFSFVVLSCVTVGSLTAADQAVGS